MSEPHLRRTSEIAVVGGQYRARPIAFVLVVLVLAMGVARFLPGPQLWGINHLAYLPLPIYLGWITCVLVLFLPAVQRLVSDALERGLPGRLLGGWRGVVALALVCTGLFALFRERSFFMGDGYLIGELVERGMRFRAFDNMDYMLHYQIFKSQYSSTGGHWSSFTIYRAGSVVAGLGAVTVLGSLVRRLPWEGWRRVFVLGLFLMSGPVALFHGYVESYSWLFLCLSAFLVAGILTLEGVVGVWLPSAFFGGALFFHLTAIFSGPALLFLALRGPTRSHARRWLEASLPALIVFLVSVILHLAAGYDRSWFEREFLRSQNAQSIWIPLSGYRGLFSAYHWKDLLNLTLITCPAAVAVVLARIKVLRARWGDPRVQFLLLQVSTMMFFAVAIDRKLGGARDWDLLAAHSLGVGLLAALLLAPFADAAPAKGRAVAGGLRADESAIRSAAFALTAAFLLTFPWVALLHLERASTARFISVAADFPDFARAYAYEEVGKYYRNAQDYDRAEEMYRLCVETYPSNGRFHILLGSIYMVQYQRAETDSQRAELIDKAEEHYRVALRSMPNTPVAISNLAQALATQGKFAEAAPFYEHLVAVEPNKDENWTGLGNVRLQLGDSAGAAVAYRNALQRNRQAPVMHLLGAALLGSGRFAEAAHAFGERLQAGDRDSRILYGLASARFGEAEQTLAGGQVPDSRGLYEAETALRELLDKDPGYAPAHDLLERLRKLQPGPTGP